MVASEKPTVEEVKPIEHSSAAPTAKLKKANKVELTPQQELQKIESDERLLELAERVEGGELLLGKDAKYFNKQMERLDELLEILGIDPDDEEEDQLDALEQLGGSEWDDLLDEEK